MTSGDYDVISVVTRQELTIFTQVALRSIMPGDPSPKGKNFSLIKQNSYKFF